MKRRTRLGVELFESRLLPTSSPLPVLLVIADQQDFYFQEYNDTRNSLLAADVPVVVAATTTNPSKAHGGSGQGTGSGVVTPSIALANVDAEDYSAIVFVGGWGASMYQYSFSGTYSNYNGNYYFNSFYNGDSNLPDGIIAPQKIAVNSLINEFLAEDKPVGGVCHGVTVLAWARVNGVSPISGKNVVVPHTDGTPAMFYNGTSYPGGFAQGQYIQALANGAIVSATGGQIGNPTTSADDVVVDGNIITAENQHSAALFGTRVAQEVIANLNQPPTPIQGPISLTINEGVPGVLASYSSTDPEGKPLSWFLIGPAPLLFNISSTGVLSGTAELDGGQFSGGVRVACADVDGDTSVLDVVINVNNVAPTIWKMIGPTTLIAGETGTFSLTGISDVSADLATMKYDFWLSTESPAPNYFVGTNYVQYQYASFSTPGTYIISGRAYDKDGGISTTKTLTINVVAAPTIGSFTVNSGEVQRSRVTQVQQRFLDVPPTAYFEQPGAIRLVRTDGVVLQRHASGQNDFRVHVNVDASGDGTVILEDFIPPYQSLPDGRWRLEIPGMNYSGPEFHVLFGDMDGNATVDASDYAQWSTNFGSSLPANSPEDFDGNGFLDASDLGEFGNRFGRTL